MYRLGFVSNSSSSSFTCSSCSTTESGQDLIPAEIDWIQCQNGHTVCTECRINAEPSHEEMRELLTGRWKDCKWKEEKLNKLPTMTDEELEDAFDEENGDNAFPIFCPICQLKEIDDGELLNYFLLTQNKTRKEMLAEIKKRFGTYDEFNKFLKGDTK